jgi:polar amino acid transport system substrate-binding protein
VSLRRRHVLVQIAAGLGTARCARGDRSLADLRARGRIRIAYALERPYSFLRSDGQVDGESAALARLVVARLGIGDIDWVAVDFDQLIPALETGRCDVVAAGMFVTADRARRVAFSRPTLHVPQGLLVRAGNPAALHSYAQAAADRRLRLAAIAGSVEAAWLRAAGVEEPRLVIVPDARTGEVAVASGLADGFALSEPALRAALAERPGRLELAQPFEQPTGGPRLGYVAFAFRRGEDELLRAWDAALGELLGGPEHAALLARLGFDERWLSDRRSVREVLE